MDDREYELKQTELALKEREVAAREREVSAKEREGKTSKLFNPLTIAIYVAAIGLFANVYTARKNNEGTEKAEHVRAQSNLLSTVIKTGNDEVTCKNLIFVVNIKLLDDPDGAIQKLCGTKGGVPALPTTSNAAAESGGGYEVVGFGTGIYGVGGYGSGAYVGGFLGSVTLTVRVEEADSHQPIANAKVDLEQPQSIQPQSILGPTTGAGAAMITPGQSPFSVLGEKKATQSTVTDAKGDAILNFAGSFDSLTVSKDGYESVSEYLSSSNLGATKRPIVLIDLHRIPKSKR